MSKLVIAITATALAVSGWTFAIARPVPAHEVTHVITRVERVPETRTVVRWKTRTVTQDTAVQEPAADDPYWNCANSLLHYWIDTGAYSPSFEWADVPGCSIMNG